MKQNCAPFISSSIRFPKINSSSPISAVEQYESLLKQMQASLSMKKSIQSIPKFNSSKQQLSYIFKSSVARFLQQKPIFDYLSLSKDKSLSNNESEKKNKAYKKHIQIVERHTIPTIPDCRNKYGCLDDLQRPSFVTKNEEQLNKEKFIMKQYKSTLIGQRCYEASNLQKKQKSGHKILEELVKKDGKVLDKQQKLVGQRNKHKPQFNHLYKQIVHTKQPNTRLGPGVYELDLNTIKSKPKKQKFQFFNSTQQRFENNQRQYQLPGASYQKRLIAMVRLR